MEPTVVEAPFDSRRSLYDSPQPACRLEAQRHNHQCDGQQDHKLQHVGHGHGPQAAQVGVEQHGNACHHDHGFHWKAQRGPDDLAHGSERDPGPQNALGCRDPADKLLSGHVESSRRVLHGRDGACPAPAGGREAIADEHGQRPGCEIDDGEEALVVHEPRSTREGPGTEAAHVKGDGADPPRDLVPAREVVVCALHPLSEVEPNGNNEAEVEDNDAVVQGTGLSHRVSFLISGWSLEGR